MHIQLRVQASIQLGHYLLHACTCAQAVRVHHANELYSYVYGTHCRVHVHVHACIISDYWSRVVLHNCSLAYMYRTSPLSARYQKRQV